MDIKVIFYQGKSWIDWLIRLFTKSKYSHVAIVYFHQHTNIEEDSFTLIEAHPKKGVIMRLNTHSYNNCKADIYNLKCNRDDARKIWDYCVSKIGKIYDYAGFLSFVIPGLKQWKAAYFCSELITEAFGRIGYIPNEEAYKTTPKELSKERILKYSHSINI